MAPCRRRPLSTVDDADPMITPAMKASTAIGSTVPDAIDAAMAQTMKSAASATMTFPVAQQPRDC